MKKVIRILSGVLILSLFVCNLYYINNVEVNAESVDILLAEEDFNFSGAEIGDAVSNYGSGSDGVGWNGNKYSQGLNADTEETYLMSEKPLKYSNIKNSDVYVRGRRETTNLPIRRMQMMDDARSDFCASWDTYGKKGSELWISFLYRIEDSRDASMVCLSQDDYQYENHSSSVVRFGSNGKNFVLKNVKAHKDGDNVVYDETNVAVSDVSIVENETYYIAVKYEFNTDNTVVSMYVNPLTSVEPTAATISITTTAAVDFRNLSFKIPSSCIDAVRVGTSYKAVTVTEGDEVVKVLPSQAPEKKLKICFFGDSITDGRQNQSFRYPLWKKFIDNGYTDIEFMGVQKRTVHYMAECPDYKGYEFPNTHMGWWGIPVCQATEWMESVQADPFTKFDFDVVDLYYGGNDFGNGESVDQVIQETKEQFEMLRKYNPNVTFVYHECHANWEPWIYNSYETNHWTPWTMNGDEKVYDYTQTITKPEDSFNYKVKKLCEEMSTEQSPIYFVPHPADWGDDAGFPETSSTHDFAHPNPRGEEQIARDSISTYLTIFEQWYAENGLDVPVKPDVTALPVPTVSPSETPEPTVTPDVSATPDLDVTATPVIPEETVSPSIEPSPDTDNSINDVSKTSKVKKIKFAKKKVCVKKGKTAFLKVKLLPGKLVKKAKKVKWIIDKNGKKVIKFVKNVKKLKGKLKVKIKAKKKGIAKVTCKAPSGKKACCKVVVR